MKAGGIYRGLLLNQAQYFSVNRISEELKELTRGGSVLIEMSDIEMQYWVGRLFLAFKNIEGIHDKKCKNGKPAQAAARLNANYYPDKEIEKACWRIVVSFMEEIRVSCLSDYRLHYSLERLCQVCQWNSTC
jgi:hypothetical protein